MTPCGFARFTKGVMQCGCRTPLPGCSTLWVESGGDAHGVGPSRRVTRILKPLGLAGDTRWPPKGGTSLTPPLGAIQRAT